MRWLTSMLLLGCLGATTQPVADPAAQIRAMIDAGTPQLAESEARELIRGGNHDPLAIGVVAHAYADRGEMGAAIQQLKMALMQAPDEPFLVKEAGRLVAWHDSQVDRSHLTATDVRMLEWIRSSAAGKQAFADAYRALVTPVPVVVRPPPTVVMQPQIVVHETHVVETRRRYDDDFGFYPYPVFIPRHVVTRPPPPAQQPPMAGFAPKR